MSQVQNPLKTSSRTFFQIINALEKNKFYFPQRLHFCSLQNTQNLASALETGSTGLKTGSTGPKTSSTGFGTVPLPSLL
jgi:hypothetical protein